MITPVLIDGADPVLQGPGYRVAVMVLGLWHVYDDVRVEQRKRDRSFADHQSTWNFHDAVGYVVTAKIDKLSSFAFGNGRHARDLHTFERRKKTSTGFG